MVLRSRTPFSAFLNMTICLIRGSPLCTASTPAFFLVRVYSFGQFDRMPSTISSSRRKLTHLRRAVHTICMALNFWHSGPRWPSEDSLRRKPNAEHQALFHRVVSLIRSNGSAESIPLMKSGRAHPELIARLTELRTLLTAHGLIPWLWHTGNQVGCWLAWIWCPIQKAGTQRRRLHGLLISGTGKASYAFLIITGQLVLW